MVDYPSLQAPIHPQLESKLFTTPLEIRQAIYSYLIPYGVHLYLHDSQLQLSACVEPCISGAVEGSERCWLEGPYISNPVLLRRIQSSWGPHWRCEERLLRIDHSLQDTRNEDADIPMLRTCKRIYKEIVNFSVDVAAVHVTDLETLNGLLQRAYRAIPETSTVSEYLTNTATLVQKLIIARRLPLTTCQALENTEGQHHLIASLDDANTWLQLWPAITRLQRLRRLHIWLDHDDKSSWSVVHERAVLSPLSTLIRCSDINVSISLPKLHPGFETPDRHFMSDSSAPLFKVERRLRQRYHAVKEGKGQWTVRFFPDFPYLYESDLSDYETMPEDEVEEMERNMWKNGEDVKAEMQARSGNYVHRASSWEEEHSVNRLSEENESEDYSDSNEEED